MSLITKAWLWSCFRIYIATPEQHTRQWMYDGAAKWAHRNQGDRV